MNLRTPWPVVGALFFLTLAKGMAAASLDLTPHEAYFWLYGKHPALGYFDHPPMIGWWIAASTALFGNGRLAVRLFPLLGGAGVALFGFLAARRLYGDRPARWAVSLAALAPFFLVLGTRATPDAPLFFFWAATLWALSKAFAGGDARWWYAAGALLGLALLSKYSALFLGAGVLLFLMCSPDQRRWLARHEPYAAGVLALAVFSPVLWWNATHGWQSFRYQGLGRFEETVGFSIKHLRDVVLRPLVLATPVVCLWAWVSGAKILASWRRASWQDRFLTSQVMPTVLFFVAVSFARKVLPNWTAPAFIGGLILVAGRTKSAPRAGRCLLGVTIAGLAVAALLVPTALWCFPGAWRQEWSLVSEEVRSERPDFILAPNFVNAAELGYQLRPLPAGDFTAVGYGTKAYPAWWDGRGLEGKDAVVVFEPSELNRGLDLLRPAFQTLESPRFVRIPLPLGRESEYALVRARGYRGAVQPNGGPPPNY